MTTRELIKACGIVTDPREHQVACFDMSRERESFAIFSEQGTGKSLMALMTAAYLYRERKIGRVLIVAPRGCYRVFVDDEIPKHLSPLIPHKVAVWSSYQTKEIKKQLETLESGGEMLRVLVVNVEACITERAANFIVDFMKRQPTLMIVDESTTIKSPTAKRTKVLINIGKYAAFRRICSGNPTPQSPLDLYSQTEFLKKNLLGYGNYFSFRNRFAVMAERRFGNRSFRQVVGFRDLEALKTAVSRFSFIVKKCDCLDLPPKIYQVRDVEMGEEQAKYYEKMANEAFIQLSATAQVTATMVLTQLVKLHQITCGFLSPDGGPEVDIPGCTRLEELMEILEQCEGKAIVWSTYRHNIRQIFSAIEEKFGKGTVGHYYGDTKVGRAEDPEEGTRIWLTKSFQNPDSKLRFIVANQASGRFGNTWTLGTTVIYYSNSYNLEFRDQSEDRSHRIGTVGPVTYIDLRTRGTVDDKILKILKAKKTLSEELVQSNWRWILGLEENRDVAN